MEENKGLFYRNYGDGQVIIAQYADNLKFILKRLNKAYKEGDLIIILTKQNL